MRPARRAVSAGSSASAVALPTITASLLARRRWTTARASGPVIQRDWPAAVAMRPSSVLASLRDTKGRPRSQTERKPRCCSLRNCGVDEGNPTHAEAAACEEANVAQFEIVAAWMVEFVAKLESKPGLLHRGEGLLPPGVALNINHPIGTILGSKLTRQGRLPSLGGFPIGLPIGVFGDSNGMAVGATTLAGITGQPFISARERHNADTTAYNSGYVSIVPIENDLTASGITFFRVRHLAHGHTH